MLTAHSEVGPTPVYRALQALVVFLVRALFSLRIEGLENVPDTGPVLLLVSHTSFLDGPVPCGVVSRVVVPVGKAELFRIPLFNQLLRWYGAIPVRRGEVDLQALRSCFRVLEQGLVLLIAPEGTRSGDGCLQLGRDGTAYVATRMDVPLAPMAVIGGEHFSSCLSQLRRTPVRVVVGPAFRLRKPTNIVPREVRHQMTQEIMYQMARLLPPERRGVYSDLSKATEEFIVYESSKPELGLGSMGRVAPAIGG